MYYEQADAITMLRKEVRRFVDDEFRPAIDTLPEQIETYHDLDPSAAAITDDVRPHPIKLPEPIREELQEKVKAAGYWAMGVPEEYGGGGLSLTERCIVLEELSKHSMGIYNPGLGILDLIPGLEDPAEVDVLFAVATDEQLDRFFFPCIEGDAHSAFALTEPAAGSDPRGMQTRAEQDGDHWVINGQKHFISFAADADFLIFFARTGPPGDLDDHGITAFIIPTDAEGLTIGPEQQVIRPEQPFEIYADDVRVPDKNVLGDVGAGLDIGKASLSVARIQYAANCLGPIDQALRLGISWANDRIVGGEPLANRQAVQWKLARSEVDYHTAKHTVYYAAHRYDTDQDARHSSSIAKYTATETLWEVLDRMIQIHGAMGVSADLPLERWLCEARIRRIGQGPSEIHLKTIARNLLKGYEDPDPNPLS